MGIYGGVLRVEKRENTRRGFLFFQWLSLFGVMVLAFGSIAEHSSASDPVSRSVDSPSRASLCDWQRDYEFFTGTQPSARVEMNTCERELSSLSRQSESAIPVQAGLTSPIGREKTSFESELREIVKGYPIEAMVPVIAEYDREIAGLIVGIAKKESNWGKRVPRTTTGDDCFNYWGYKGAGARGVAMGHGCFGETTEAVHAIGTRLQELVALRRTSEPANLVIWKCGSSCASHSPESVRKWISDVDIYFRAIARK
jgi:hypothetical protein